MSLMLLKSIEEKGTRYSKILVNKGVLDKVGGEDPMVSEMHKLIAKGFLEIKYVYDKDEGEDFVLTVTKLGKSFIKFKENADEEEDAD